MATLELSTERIAAGGDAVAREPSGRVVFVTGALPGERVRARVVGEKAHFARAVVVDVLSPAPARRAPPCPFVVSGCGGCGWQHVHDGDQVALKLAIVSEALSRIGGLAEARVVAGPPLDPFGFRTSLRVGVDAQGQAGFRARRSHDLVGVDHCLVAHPRLDELLASARFPGATEVTLRCGARTGDRLASVEPAAATPAAELPPDVATGRRARYREVVGGRTFQISARSFFQTRTDGADLLVELVRQALGDRLADGVLVDAYAGVGLFAATVGHGREVVAIESSAAACADARRNLAGAAATIVHGDLAHWRPVPAAAVVADPARAGLGRRGAATIAGTGAPVLVLVSCDPVALARDAGLLAALGYDHSVSTVVDLFPQTPRVEVVTRFERR